MSAQISVAYLRVNVAARMTALARSGLIRADDKAWLIKAANKLKDPQGLMPSVNDTASRTALDLANKLLTLINLKAAMPAYKHTDLNPAHIQEHFADHVQTQDKFDAHITAQRAAHDLYHNDEAGAHLYLGDDKDLAKLINPWQWQNLDPRIAQGI